MQQHRKSIILLYEKSSLQNEPVCSGACVCVCVRVHVCVCVCVSRSHLEDPCSALDELVSGADEGW